MNGVINLIGEIDAALTRFYFQQPWSEREKVLISSPGGDVGYMLAILDDFDANKTITYATGINQSAAAVLATCSEGWRYATADALFRFIEPEKTEKFTTEEGSEDFRVPNDRWFIHSVVVNRLASRLHIPVPEAYDLFDGKFISSIRAKELNLIDEVLLTYSHEKGTYSAG